MYNTPPTYGIYVLGLVAKWVEDMGGVKAMQESVLKSVPPCCMITSILRTSTRL